MGTGYFTPRHLNLGHALGRRLHIRRPHCPGKKKQSCDILRANNNRLFNHVTSPSLSRSTEAAASSSSSLLRYCCHVTSTGPMETGYFTPRISITVTLYKGGCVLIVLIAQVLWSRDILRTNWNRLFYPTPSPSLSASTEAAASSLSSLPR